MGTIKQEKALSKIIKNGGNISQAMRDVGYSENTAKTPKKLTDSDGFIELCEELGLTKGLIIKSLVEDIKKKPQNRKQELELGAKIRGMFINKTDIAFNEQSIIWKEGKTYLNEN